MSMAAMVGFGSPPAAASFSIGVSGPSMVTGSGASLLLQGASVSGPEFTPTQTGAIWPSGFNSGNGPNQAFFNVCKAWGINCLRWPINCWNWLADQTPSAAVISAYGATTPGDPSTGIVDYNHKPNNTTLSTTCTGVAYRNAILSAVDLAAQNGIYSVVDLHWSDPYGLPGYSMAKFGGTNTTFTSGHAQIKQPTLVDVQFWTDMATRMASRPYVMLELANECTENSDGGGWGWGGTHAGVGGHTTANSNWINGGSFTYPFNIGNDTSARTVTSVGMQTLITTIRNVGATNVIVIPGVVFEGDISQFNTTGSINEASLGARFLDATISDPLNNFALAFHAYENTGSANSISQKDNNIGYTNPPVGTANWNYPIFCTEFGPSGYYPGDGTEDGSGLTTTGTATLPGTVTMTTTIPTCGNGVPNSTIITPWVTAAQTTYTDPNGHSISSATRNASFGGVTQTYGDISGSTMTGVGGSGTVTSGTVVTGNPAANPTHENELGYVLNTCNWHKARAASNGRGAGTQTGARSLHLFPWNLNPTAGPSMWSDWSGTPTNFGLAMERYFLTGVC